MTAHAKLGLGPSTLARTVQCEGWANLVALMPEQPEGEEATEGHAAHWVAMQIALASMEQTGGTLPKLGDKVHGGLLVDKEMLAGGHMYAESLEGFEGWAEETLTIERIHPEMFGTPDFWQWSPATRTLRVTDYKYGRKFVEVWENWQLIAYAIGLLDRLGYDGNADIIVKLMIVQPRCYHPDGPVREWTTSAHRLRTMANIAHNKAHLSQQPGAVTRAGSECLYCPARATCKTAHAATAGIMEFAYKGESMAQTPEEMGKRLAFIQEAQEMLKAVATGLEEQVIHSLKAGKVVSDFKVDYVKSREKWAKPVAEVKMLGMLYGLNLVTEDYACTPKQALKLRNPLGKTIDPSVISKYSVTPPGAPKLVLDELSKHARIFSK